MTNFITNNQPKDLSKRLISLIENSKELKFLVGFFYFSGLKELYEGLKNNPNVTLKVLVGLKVDCAAYGLCEYGDNKKKSDKAQVEEFFDSIKKSINTETFDNQQFYTQVKFFIDLVKNDRLIIRKTLEPNHAKLYIFKLEDKQVGRNQLFITGSSNLTKPGLTKEQEFNVEISDYGFDEANGYFDELWKKAVPITEKAINKSDLIRLLEKNTLIKEITPFEAYTLVLKNYLDGFKGKELNKRLIEVYNERAYKPYKYQLDAVSQALSIIEQNNGVIIADVVGLGKTIIACAVAYELRKRGIVICPPGLLGDKSKKSGWSKYLEHFHLTSLGWEAFSLGDLDKVIQHLNVAKDVEVVIIDEAHRFRNEDTQSYESLKNICRGKIVILLTATPFNNRPSDIFSLLKLFIVPKKSTITLNDNLESKFDNFKTTFDKLAYIKRYCNSQDNQKRSRSISYYISLFHNPTINPNEIKKHAHRLAKEIKNVIEPVTIRRNRLDLQKNPYYKDEINQLSVIENPKEWFYELTNEQSDFYNTILKKYFAQPEEGGEFTGAIYRPFTYEVDTQSVEDTSKGNGFQLQQQVNLYDFMRRLLVKRFESSFGAFKQSVANFRNITEIARKFIKDTGKYILDRDLLENIYTKEIEDIEKELNNYVKKIVQNEYPKNHKIYEINKFKYKDKFLQDIDKDIALFDAILNELEQLNLVNNDPKVACLVDNVNQVLNEPPQNNEPKRKIVIFSEYLDTVLYLKPILQRRFNNRVLVIAGGLTKTNIDDIYLNFDASYPKQKDDYDILLGTDRISEGFDLNR
ncbi:MAG TPA: SNF2-related protein, partial [Verrucomicrobiota bacterium]|nr:SNF2-related protein [Verrucomicrobiota bacterium]